MIKIRQNVFETNSSSTHSITMCTQGNYDDWQSGKLFYHHWYDDKPWYTYEEMLEYVLTKYGEEDAETIQSLKNKNEDEFIAYIRDFDFYTYESFDKYNAEYEQYTESFTTDNGETIIAFGYYGSDY